MSEDWAAAAKAINERVAALGMSQRDLSDRANVPLAVVRELQGGSVAEVLSRRMDTIEEQLAEIENCLVDLANIIDQVKDRLPKR